MKLSLRTALPTPLPIALLLAAVLAPSAALADANYADQKTADGFNVVFKDDPMSADRNDAAGARIPVRPGAARVTLIKPRTQFIDAMLKSVESI